MVFFIRSKKNIILFLSFALIVLGFLYFIFYQSLFGFFEIQKSFFSKKKSQGHVFSSNLKSPCRDLTGKGELKKQKAILFSNRVDRLNELMETPIDWIFKNIKGEVFDLYCYRGKKRILINLWATWCPPCIEELPSLSALAEQTKNILVIAVTTESLEVVNSFIQKSFPDLSESLQIVRVSKEELNQYFIPDSLPVTYLFNKEGKLESKILGARNWQEMSFTQQE